ncbi:MAG: hypothetical protein PHY93_17300 [Bacteriovorax sp.]|nr:hypothetical protein [Bacteriovorax sp.]
MKKIIIIVLGMLFTQNLWASTGYDILIDQNGYDLKIELDFNNYQSLENVRHALVSSVVISQLSPNVQSVTNSGKLDDYQSLMVVKSFGIKSELLSKCKETYKENKDKNHNVKEWSRSCVLQTELLDSGKYMAWKTDQVICTKKSEQNVNCLFVIKGKTKPLIFLGFKILNEKSFAVKTKLQALNNFFKIYYFVSDHNISTKLANARFDKSKIKQELESFDSDATQKFKTESVYKRSFKL